MTDAEISTATDNAPTPTLAELDQQLLTALLSGLEIDLQELHAALTDSDHRQAEMIAESTRDRLANAFTDAARQAGLSHVATWLSANANGHAGTMRELLGLPPLAPSDATSTGLREALIGQCLDEAATTESADRRDELLATAVETLAHLGPLAVLRWRREFSKLGVDRRTFEQLMDDARAKIRADGPTSDRPEQIPQLSAVRNGQLYFAGEALTNFAAKITHELMVDDGLTPPAHRYTIEGRMANGERLDKVEVPADEFSSMAWVAKLWGARPVFYGPPSKNWVVRRAIQETSLAEMKRERVYTYTGWTTIDGKRAYLSSGGAVTADGFDSSVRVELGASLLRSYALPAPPEDPRRAMQSSLEFLSLAPLSVTLPIWTAMYAAPLTPLYPLNAMLWIYGTTQSRKSTLAMLGLTHFGPAFVRNREYRAPKDWISTKTDLEGALFTMAHMPLVIDDFAPQNTGPNQMRDMHVKADLIVRSVGNRSGRGRANADLSEKAPRPPRGLAISTAELQLIGHSIAGRLIYVPVEPGQVQISQDGTGPLDKAQSEAGMTGPGYYAQAMSAYIRWLASHWEQMQETSAAEFEAANQFARTQFPSTQSRLMDYYAVLMISARTAARFALRCGALSQLEHDRLVSEVWPATLVELLRKQSDRVAGQSPVRRFAEALAELLATNRAYLNPRTGSDTPPGPPAPGAQIIGWYDMRPPKIYLLSGVCIALVREHCQRMGEPLEITSDALRRELDQIGVVAEKDKSGQFEKAVYAAGHGRQVRTLVLDSQLLAKATGIYLYPDRTAPSPDPEPGADDFTDATQAAWGVE